MKKLIILVLLSSFILLSGCSKSDLYQIDFETPREQAYNLDQNIYEALELAGLPLPESIKISLNSIKIYFRPTERFNEVGDFLNKVFRAQDFTSKITLLLKEDEISFSRERLKLLIGSDNKISFGLDYEVEPKINRYEAGNMECQIEIHIKDKLPPLDYFKDEVERERANLIFGIKTNPNFGDRVYYMFGEDLSVEYYDEKGNKLAIQSDLLYIRESVTLKDANFTYNINNLEQYLRVKLGPITVKMEAITKNGQEHSYVSDESFEDCKKQIIKQDFNIISFLLFRDKKTQDGVSSLKKNAYFFDLISS
jgi:hypothetical protein